MSSTLLRIRQLISPLSSSSCRRAALARGYAATSFNQTTPEAKTHTPFVRIVDGLYKTYKPISPGIRHLRRPLTPWLYKGGPLRALTVAKRGTGGRNANGRITVRGLGGGHKRRIRVVDFMRTETGVHDVVRIEYDPNRSAHIALLKNRDTTSSKPWCYILAPEGLSAGQAVQSFRGGIPDNLLPGFVDPKRTASSAAVRPTPPSFIRRLTKPAYRNPRYPSQQLVSRSVKCAH